MPVFFETRTYSYSFSVDSEDVPSTKEKQECRLALCRIDLERVSDFERLGKYKFQNDFGDVGGTVAWIDGQPKPLEVRYKDFCEIMDKFIGKAIDETSLIQNNE